MPHSAWATRKDDTHIDIGDSQAVSLAAIKGFNAKVDEQTTLLQSRIQAPRFIGGCRA
jgi:hypothetical protein